MIRSLGLFLVLLLWWSDAPAQQRAQPEGATGRGRQVLVTAHQQMVVSANPVATRAGHAILQAGGSAIDAAIAMQAMLTLVEPQSSGIGGGAFVVYWDAARRRITTYDGRETAPAAVNQDLFLAEGRPLQFFDAVTGGISTGAPGVPRLLEHVHRLHGRLPWAPLFQPAIELAERGFTVSPRLAGLIEDDRHLRNDREAGAYFFNSEGRPRAAGEVLQNPALAATLRTLARDGADAFYRGPIADAILEAVAREPRPGRLTREDLAAYRVVERDAVCGPYRGYRVCGMGPPSSGGVAVLQILGLLEAFNLGAAPSPQGAHLFALAGRLAFADRNAYLADPGFVPQPVAGLIDRGYLATRAQLMNPARDIGAARPGDPPGRAGWFAPDEISERAATSHLIVIDRAGNIVSMTTTIEDAFGSRRMAAGFLLNNQLTDFNFAPVADGRPVANRVEPGKRPRSSMAPTIVFDQQGAPAMVIGSPGGSLIIPYVARTIVALIDWRMDPQAALDLGHFANRNGPTELEAETPVAQWDDALRAMGHTVRIIPMTSGLSAVVRRDGAWQAGADPRREGLALGD